MRVREWATSSSAVFLAASAALPPRAVATPSLPRRPRVNVSSFRRGAPAPGELRIAARPTRFGTTAIF